MSPVCLILRGVLRTLPYIFNKELLKYTLVFYNQILDEASGAQVVPFDQIY